MQKQMAVETVASFVIQKLTDMLTEVPISNEKVLKDLTEIKKDLEEIKGNLLNTQQDKPPNDDNVKNWAEHYLVLLYQVEDAIDSFALRIVRQRTRLGFLMNGLFLKNSAACCMLSRKIKKIRVEIKTLRGTRPKGVEDAGNYRLAASDVVASPCTVIEEHVGNSLQRNMAIISRSAGDTTIYRDRYRQAKLMYSYSYYEEELDIVGFKSEMDSLVKSLTDESSIDDFVSIVGETGSGKTTLARAVYGNRQVQDSFECRAWVTLSNDYDAINFYWNLLKQVGKPEDQDVRIDEELLKNTLLTRLGEKKKYLIVLDDVSSSIWEYLRGVVLPSNTNGSKVLITCHKKLPEVHGNSTPLEMTKLSEKDSWDLFSKKVGWEISRAGAERDDPHNVPWKILEACNFLPLNIVLLGSLLSAQNAEIFERRIQELSSKESWETKDILNLCYDDLTDFLKLCLLYMLLFPPELDIPVRRLLRLWQAEGFGKRPDKTDIFPENVAQEYFDDLVKRSLIQVSKLRSDGRPRTCRLLGVLRDYLLPKALGVRLFHVHTETSNTCEDESRSSHFRRLVEYRDIDHCSFYQSQHRERLRSFLSFNDRKKDTPAKEVGNLLDHIIRNGKPFLRVLDLEGLYKPSLPENLGDFFRLRYLGLRWTFLDTLPKSIGDLYYLETLDVKHTNIRTLPSSVWKLKHLRHLNLGDNIRPVPKNMPSSLPDILTLWGLSVDDEILQKFPLNSLKCLSELGITFHLSNSGKLLDWISNLTALQQLKLQSVDDKGNPSDLIFQPLSELKELYYLYLLGNLRKLPEIQDFPQGIKVLTLSVSGLKHDPMPILGQLPSLTVLRLLNSYSGTEISCREEGFKELQVLKLWKLEKLEKWELKEGAMLRLKELNLRGCNNLKSIPSRLLQQQRFKELTLTDMPEEVSKQVEQEKSHHIYVTIKNTSNNSGSDGGYLVGVDSKS